MGSTKSTIAGFALTADNYEAAVALLKKRFGKKNTIQRAHIDELMKVASVYNERDTSRLRALYDGVETHYRGLTAIGDDEMTHASIVVLSILDKCSRKLEEVSDPKFNVNQAQMDCLSEVLLNHQFLLKSCSLTQSPLPKVSDLSIYCFSKIEN